MNRPPLDVNAAARLAGSVQLVNIACVGVSAEFVNSGARTPGTTLSWDLPDPTGVWSLEERSLTAFFAPELLIDVSEDNGASSQRLAQFRVKFQLEYDLKPDSTWSEEDVPHYVGVTGLLHLWPYFRAEIQMLTTKLGLPPLVLPVIVSGHAARRVKVKRAGSGPSERARRSRTRAPKRALKKKT